MSDQRCSYGGCIKNSIRLVSFTVLYFLRVSNIMGFHTDFFFETGKENFKEALVLLSYRPTTKIAGV